MGAREYINVKIVCGGTRSTSAIEMFFKKINHERIQIVKHKKDIDILIADLDHYQQRKLILNISQANPKMSTIYLSVRTKQDAELQESLDFHDGQLVLKPLTYKSLLSALKKAITQLNARKSTKGNKESKKNIQSSNPPPILNIKVEESGNTHDQIEDISTPVTVTPVAPVNDPEIQSTRNSQPDHSTDTNDSDLVINGNGDEHTANLNNSDNHDNDIPQKFPSKEESQIWRSGIMMNRYSERAFIGSLKDIQFNSEVECKSARYQSKFFLQQYLSDAALFAKTNNTSIELTFSSCTMTINQQANLIKIDDELGAVMSIAKIPIQKNKITVIPTNNEWEIINGKELALDRILWQTTLLAARGRVPNDTDFFEPISLKYWPNMTRLILFPHALRIAALWTQHNYSLEETARLLRIEHRFIFSFYSAARSIGLIENHPRYDNIRETFGQQNFDNIQNRSLLEKFLRHIRSR